MRRLSIVLFGVAFGALGCDTGGLLLVDGKNLDGGKPEVVQGPNVNEFTNSGNVATNAKYRIVFTMGQATPNQGVDKGTTGELHGGIVGAMNGK
jgi:hypothetical protein